MTFEFPLRKWGSTYLCPRQLIVFGVSNFEYLFWFFSIKPAYKYSIFKIRHVQIDELPRTLMIKFSYWIFRMSTHPINFPLLFSWLDIGINLARFNWNFVKATTPWQQSHLHWWEIIESITFCSVNFLVLAILNVGSIQVLKFNTKVSFFLQCTQMQLITLQNFNIQTGFSQFLWLFSLKCWFKGQIISRIHSLPDVIW